MLNILQASQTFQAASAVCKLTYPTQSSSWPPLNEIWTILDPHLSASHMKFKLQTVHVQKALACKPDTKAALGHMAGPTALSRGNGTAINSEMYQNQTPALKYARECFCFDPLFFLHEKKKSTGVHLCHVSIYSLSRILISSHRKGTFAFLSNITSQRKHYFYLASLEKKLQIFSFNASQHLILWSF